MCVCVVMSNNSFEHQTASFPFGQSTRRGFQAENKRHYSRTTANTPPIADSRRFWLCALKPANVHRLPKGFDFCT